MKNYRTGINIRAVEFKGNIKSPYAGIIRIRLKGLAKSHLSRFLGTPDVYSVRFEKIIAEKFAFVKH